MTDRKDGKNKYWHVLALPAVLLLLAGCESRTRYEVLTVFFTGVPPYEEYVRENGDPGEPVDSVPVQQKKYDHPLWKTGSCASCHVIRSVQEEVTPGRGRDMEADIISPLSAGAPPLRQQPEKLCIRCHTDKTPRRAIRDRLWLHNPVARGRCLDCHAPHSSSYPAHLREDNRVMCVTCHAAGEDDLPSACLKQEPDEETGQIDCLSCHNPHMGKDRYLLRGDYSERKFTVQQRS